jgi:hypothetical protein
MISKELLNNIDKIRQNLKNFHSISDDTTSEMILAKAVKLSEEV